MLRFGFRLEISQEPSQASSAEEKFHPWESPYGKSCEWELGYCLIATCTIRHIVRKNRSWQILCVSVLNCSSALEQYSKEKKKRKKRKENWHFFSPSFAAKNSTGSRNERQPGGAGQLPKAQSIHHTLDLFSPDFHFLRACTTHNHAKGHTTIGSSLRGEVKLQRSRILGIWEHRNDRCLFFVDAALLRPTDLCESFHNSLLGLGWL